MNVLLLVTFHVVFQGVCEWGCEKQWTEELRPAFLLRCLMYLSLRITSEHNLSYVRGCAEYLKSQANLIDKPMEKFVTRKPANTVRVFNSLSERRINSAFNQSSTMTLQ